MDHELEVRYIGGGKGRGVFARRAWRRRQVIERCHIYAIVNHQRAFEIEGLDDYELAWGHRKVAFAGGYAHLYNHSARPNVSFERDLMRGFIVVRALRAIAIGDELCHKYACPPWFTVAE